MVLSARRGRGEGLIGEEQVEVKEERKEDGPNTPWRDIADAAHGKTDGRGRTREQWRGRWQWRRRSHGYHRGKASSALKQRNSANNEQGREGRRKGGRQWKEDRLAPLCRSVCCNSSAPMQWWCTSGWPASQLHMELSSE